MATVQSSHHPPSPPNKWEPLKGTDLIRPVLVEPCWLGSGTRPVQASGGPRQGTAQGNMGCVWGWEVQPCPSWLRTSGAVTAVRDVAGEVVSFSLPFLLSFGPHSSFCLCWRGKRTMILLCPCPMKGTLHRRPRARRGPDPMPQRM